MKPDRFRFRAWCKSTLEMIPWYEFDFSSLGNPCLVSMDYENRVGVPRDDFIIMQSTGLCDENGVEIFEGDILRFALKELADGKMQHSGVVEWHELLHGWYVYIGGGYKRLASCSPRLVIGNIYQNPELLK